MPLIKIGDVITWTANPRSGTQKTGKVIAVINPNEYAFSEALVEQAANNYKVGRLIGVGIAETMSRYLVAVKVESRSRNGARVRMDLHTPRVEYLERVGTKVHASDCAVHNEPAEAAGECNC